MGIHYDYKSTKSAKLMEKQAKREKKLAEKKAKRLAKDGQKRAEDSLPEPDSHQAVESGSLYIQNYQHQLPQMDV